MGFPGQENWSGWPFPSPGDLPDPGIEPISPALLGRFFTTKTPGKQCAFYHNLKKIVKGKKKFASIMEPVGDGNAI